MALSSSNRGFEPSVLEITQVWPNTAMPNDLDKKSYIVVLTRVSGDNCGNHALSASLIGMIENLFPNDRIITMSKEPRFPQRTVRELRAPYNERDFLPTFQVAAAYWENLAGHKQVSLDISDFAVRKIRSGHEGTRPEVVNRKRRLKRLVRWARKKLLSEPDTCWPALARIQILRNAKLIVWNPAGEIEPFSDGHIPIQILLELEVARRFGARFCIVNHTVESGSQPLRDVISFVYPKAKFVTVRETRSAEILKTLAVPAGQILQAPDLVFSLVPASTLKIKDWPNQAKPKIGIAINSRSIPNADSVKALIKGVTQNDFQVTLVSNALLVDFPLYKMLKREGLKISSQAASLGYEAYIEYLRTFDVVITSRLHTAIFSMLTATPVIPIEPQDHKMSAHMEEIAYPIRTLRMVEPDWVGSIIRELEHIHNNRLSIEREIKQIVRKQAQVTGRCYERAFRFVEKEKMT